MRRVCNPDDSHVIPSMIWCFPLPDTPGIRHARSDQDHQANRRQNHRRRIGQVLLGRRISPSFGLRVRASGRKYYVVQFRANGRLRRMTLGRHGAVTPETARRRAMALISEAKGGKDPAALRDKGRKAATMKVSRQALSGRVRPGSLQAEHGLRVPPFGEVLHRPQDRNPQGDGDPAERHRRTAPWHAGDALPGQPDLGRAFKDV